MSAHGSLKINSMKIKRDAFLFMTPKVKSEFPMFAQCALCRMFVDAAALAKAGFKGAPGGRCIAHGSGKPIDAPDSCGLFIIWPSPNGRPVPHVVVTHAKELASGLPASVTAKESGFVSHRVQCHRCKFADGDADECDLYKDLNKSMPDKFELDSAITPNSCCNAHVLKSDDKSNDTPYSRYGGLPAS